MISEGTDIPRLQVCCHLSTVKTELHFRQVLGRILRVSQRKNQEAWLFTLATDELTLYSERLANDLPKGYNVLQDKAEEKLFPIYETLPSSVGLSQKSDEREVKEIDLKIDFSEENDSGLPYSQNTQCLKVGSLYQRVIDAFLFTNM